MRGEKSCPCFGKTSLDPSVVALLESVIAFALVFCPLPKTGEPSYSSAPWRLYCFGVVYLLVSVPAFFNMVYYAHRGLSLDLRADRRLAKMMQHQLREPSSEEILELLRKSTGLEFTIDDRLRDRPPNYGFWSTGKAWSVMIGMGEKQLIPTRWDKTDHGYNLAVAAPWGNPAAPWFVSSIIFGAAFFSLSYFAWNRGRQPFLRGFGF
jgi:hypothetical protein